MQSGPISFPIVAISFALISIATDAIAAEASQVPDYAAWKTVNKDGSWTAAAENAVQALRSPTWYLRISRPSAQPMKDWMR